MDTFEKIRALLAEQLDIDPESLRPKTRMKYNALDRTVTCLSCLGDIKLRDYDNPEDVKYCPFCGLKAEELLQ